MESKNEKYSLEKFLSSINTCFTHLKENFAKYIWIALLRCIVLFLVKVLIVYAFGLPVYLYWFRVYFRIAFMSVATIISIVVNLIIHICLGKPLTCFPLKQIICHSFTPSRILTFQVFDIFSYFCVDWPEAFKFNLVIKIDDEYYRSNDVDK